MDRIWFTSFRLTDAAWDIQRLFDFSISSRRSALSDISKEKPTPGRMLGYAVEMSASPKRRLIESLRGCRTKCLLRWCGLRYARYFLNSQDASSRVDLREIQENTELQSDFAPLLATISNTEEFMACLSLQMRSRSSNFDAISYLLRTGFFSFQIWRRKSSGFPHLVLDPSPPHNDGRARTL